VFDWSNKSNGYLLGGMGILSALLQGGYVRRSTSKIGEVAMARQGVNACAIALALLSAVPAFVDAGSRAAAIRCLLGAAVCMAFTSATVVSALTASASLLTEDPVLDPATGAVKDVHPELAKGKALGQHRSSGQLGRAVGPLIGTCKHPSGRRRTDLGRSLRCVLDAGSARDIQHLGMHDVRTLVVDATARPCRREVQEGLKRSWKEI
jgi:hypothetical protein